MSKAMVVAIIVWWLAPGVIINVVPPQYQPIVITSLNGAKNALASIWTVGTKMIADANPQLVPQ